MKLKIKFPIEEKGGPGSGFHGHAGRPGHVGGSSGEGGGSGGVDKPPLSRPSKVYGRKAGFDRGFRADVRMLKNQGAVDHSAIVGDAEMHADLATHKQEYPDTKFYLAKLGNKKVRIMGYFGSDNPPQPGDRVAIALDNIMTGKAQNYKGYFGNVIDDDGGRYPLWFYD